MTPLTTTEGFAVILGKSPRWVRDQVAAGRIACTRIGGSIRFTEKQMNDYIESHERPSLAPAVNGWGRRRRRSA